MRLILALLAVATLGAQAPARPTQATDNLIRCYVSNFRGAAGPEGPDAEMGVVSDGLSCAITNFGLPESRQNPATEIRLTQTPSHGRIAPAPPRVIYTHPTGYSGPDAFAYDATTTTAAGAPVTLRVRVKVDVRTERFARTTVPGSVIVGRDVPYPQKIKDVRPVYPSDAIRTGVQSMVYVQATIGTDGKVTNAVIMRSIPLLDAAALDAVRQWEFTPSLLTGQPIAVTITATVNFSVQPGQRGTPAARGAAFAARAAVPTAAPVVPGPPPIEDALVISRILDRNHDLDFDKGKQFLQRQQFFDALREFKKANDGASGKCAECYLAMAQTYEGMGASKNVADASAKAIDLASPADTNLLVQAHQLKGRALQTIAAIKDAKKLVEAEHEFRQALALDQDAAYLHFGLGVVLMQQHRDAEGIDEMKAELAVRPAGARSELATNLIKEPRGARESFAPDFAVVTLDRELVSLSDLRGKVILLDFWGSWCPPCVSAVPWLRDLQKKHAKEPFAIVGVSSDSNEGLVRDFTGKHQMMWAQFWDRDRKFQQTYEIRSWPTYIVIDEQGIVRLRGGGGQLEEIRVEDEIKRELKTIVRSRVRD